MEEMGCADAEAYGTHLARHEEEWRVLDGLCRVTISRFYRDRHVFDALRTSSSPSLPAGRRPDALLSCAPGVPGAPRAKNPTRCF
jgi:chemotaxis methyl-accepting protein methylase